MQYCSFTASDFTFTTRHMHSWASFPLWFSLFFPSGAVSPFFSLLDTYWPGCLIFQCRIFLLFHTVAYCSWVVGEEGNWDPRRRQGRVDWGAHTWVPQHKHRTCSRQGLQSPAHCHLSRLILSPGITQPSTGHGWPLPFLKHCFHLTSKTPLSWFLTYLADCSFPVPVALLRPLTFLHWLTPGPTLPSYPPSLSTLLSPHTLTSSCLLTEMPSTCW